MLQAGARKLLRLCWPHILLSSILFRENAVELFKSFSNEETRDQHIKAKDLEPIGLLSSKRTFSELDDTSVDEPREFKCVKTTVNNDDEEHEEDESNQLIGTF